VKVQEILDIASRYNTPMADAMVCACRDWSIGSGESLTFTRIVEPREPTVVHVSDEDWERLSSENADLISQRHTIGGSDAV
jgi:hypothetical protein